MPASIGVNLRVTGHCRQGGRKYMEDFFSVAYQQTEDERDLEYAFFGIYDGHGGAEAAAFAKEHLMEIIVKQKNFWSENDAEVLRAIKDGYIATHYAMWKEQEKWPKTASGLPSTAGTTASVAFIRHGKIYIGHVGDSGIILGYQEPGCSEWKAKPLTKEHKPESAMEMSRIESCGGKVVSKSGVPRVVWNRPRIGHQGPVRRSTPIDEIPFLAVARSLGDLWSYNSQLDEFVVSPDPDCSVIPIDTSTFRCLIFGTDGLYNMLSPQMAVHIVQQAERHNENAALSDDPNKVGWLNPSKCLVEKALERWSTTKMRADNTSVVTLMLDPPGPPRAQVLKNKKKNSVYPDSGLKIVTRYEDNDKKTNILQEELMKNENATTSRHSPEKNMTSTGVNTVLSCTDVLHTSNDDNTVNCVKTAADKTVNSKVEEESSSTMKASIAATNTCTNLADLVNNFVQKTRESLSYDVRKTTSDSEIVNNNCCSSTSIDQEIVKSSKSSENIQIHEISSSSNDNYDLEDENVNFQSKFENCIEITKKTMEFKFEKKNCETKDNKKQQCMSTRSRNNNIRQPKNGQANKRMEEGTKLLEENCKSLRSRSPSKTPIKSEKNSIKESLRSTKKLTENLRLRSRKRVLPTTNENTKDSCSPMKRLKESSSSSKVTQTSNICIIAPESSRRTRKKQLDLKFTRMRSKSRLKAEAAMKADKVVLKQKMRALQKIMTKRVPNFNSGIIFENRKLKPVASKLSLNRRNISKNKDIKTVEPSTSKSNIKALKMMKDHSPKDSNKSNRTTTICSKKPANARVISKIDEKVPTSIPRKSLEGRRSTRSLPNILSSSSSTISKAEKSSPRKTGTKANTPRKSVGANRERSALRSKNDNVTLKRSSRRSALLRRASSKFEICRRNCC